MRVPRIAPLTPEAIRVDRASYTPFKIPLTAACAEERGASCSALGCVAGRGWHMSEFAGADRHLGYRVHNLGKFRGRDNAVAKGVFTRVGNDCNGSVLINWGAAT